MSSGAWSIRRVPLRLCDIKDEESCWDLLVNFLLHLLPQQIRDNKFTRDQKLIYLPCIVF